MEEGRDVYRVLVEKPERKRPLGDPDIDKRIILRWTLMKQNVGLSTGLSWLRIGTFDSTCECVNEPAGSIKFGEFLDQLQTG
jgi:hypothetical protein